MTLTSAEHLCNCIDCRLHREAMAECRAKGFDLSKAPNHRLCEGCRCRTCIDYFASMAEPHPGDLPWEPRIARAA